MEFLVGSAWIYASGIIFAASLIQALTGFGFGLVAVPLLLLILPSEKALMAGMVLSTISALYQGIKMRKLARWDLVQKLLLLSLPGLILGVVFSHSLNSTYIKGIVGAVLIVYVVWQGLKTSRKNKLKKTSNLEKEEESLKPLKASSIEFISAGVFSGLLNGLAAIPGPPIVALLVKHLDKETFQATTVNFFILQYTITITMKLIVTHEAMNVSFAVMILSLILPIILGHIAGQPIRERINEENFKKLVYSLLFIIGVSSVWEPLKNFLI